MKPFRFLSLFSGMEGASVAAQPYGWECAAVAEIDPNACWVLHHRFGCGAPRYMPKPDDAKTTAEARARRAAIKAVSKIPPRQPASPPNLGDISQVTEQDIIDLGPIDLAIGGFPCQDVSVAGKGRGIKKGETRSGLFFDAMRVVRWARERCGLRWLVLENVPGIYSNRGGADFAAVVNEILGTDFDVPGTGWENCGVASGPEGLLEWATLDAQFFGVPQRRRRMFALVDFGDWTSRPPLLLEPESLLGYSPPRREEGKGTSHDVAPSLVSSGRGVERGGG